MERLRYVLLVSLLGLAIGLVPAYAQSWDVAADYSATQNPNGVWTLGSVASLGGALTAYPWAFDAQSGSSLPGWTGPDNPGIFIKNVSDVVKLNATNVIEPGKLFWQPGDTEFVMARWTSPVNGYVSISALFTAQDNSGGGTTDPHVLKNGVSIYSGAVVWGFYGSSTNNYTDRIGDHSYDTFSTVVQVAVNDTIDFAVGIGGDSQACDGAGLEATITVVPEPSGLLALGGAFVGMLGFVRRRSAR